MKNNNSDIDKLITEALTDEEARYFAELEEQAIPFQFIGLFKGKNAWLTILVGIVGVAFFGLAVYAGYHFFTSNEILEMTRWGFIFIFALIGISMIKMFSWNQMDKNTLIREIKRLEYQISLLSKKEDML